MCLAKILKWFKTAHDAPKNHDLEWSQANSEMAKVILKQGELLLDAQLKIALAADQRSMVSAGICAAFAGAITTAIVANYSQYRAVDIATSGGVIAVGLLISAALFLFCARPTNFKTVGNEPIKWWEVRNDQNLAVAIGGECENYQRNIESNNALLKNNAWRYWFGVKIAMCTPLLGGFTFLAFHRHSILAILRLL